MIVLDIWGGELSMDHVARYILPTDQAMKRGVDELEAGYLVNLRKDTDFGIEHTFDRRVGGAA